MGIKDKVLDILFDDEGDDSNRNYGANDKPRERQSIDINKLVDTGSIFIDATSPLPKNNNKTDTENINNNETKTSSSSGYQMSENISPIFGIIDGKNKKNKNVSKMKSFNDLSNKTFDTSSKKETPAYTSVVISPIFGPISTKPIKRTTKPRKKTSDPFERDINDTGSFDAILDETEEQEVAPDFEDQTEEVVEQVEMGGDTDRLVKISDKINRIKNEAANIYSADESSDDDHIVEDDNHTEPVEYENISDVIHHVQNYDGKVEHIKRVKENEEDQIPQILKTEFNNDTANIENKDTEPSYVEEYDEPEAQPEKPMSFEQDDSDDFVLNETFETNNSEETTNNTPNSQVSVDDIFQDEDNEEEKDLFSTLFGDE